MATEAPPRRRKFWGWGYEDQQPPHAEVEAAAAGIVAHLGFGASDVERPARVEDLDLPEPRLAPPAALEEICSSDPHSRASHALGKAYRDVVRAFRGEIAHPPDLVATPRDEDELEQAARPVRIGRGGGDPLRGRDERGRRGGAALRAARGVDRPRRAGGSARGRPASRWRRASAPAAPGPPWRTSCASTASRCATTRSRSSSPRSGAGSRRAPAVTSPPARRTSTTWSSRSERSLRAASGRAGDCRGRGPAPAPTAC